MAEKRPLCLYAGRIEEMRQSDFVAGAVCLPFPRKTATPKIAGEVSGGALSTLTLIAERQYFMPFAVGQQIALTGLQISVTTAAAGTASVGIYSNNVISENDVPGSLVAAVSGLNTGTTGDKSGSVSYVLIPGLIYWASVIASENVSVRSLGVSSIYPALGRSVGGTSAISYIYSLGGIGSTLPSSASTFLSDGTGGCPAIYLVGT